MASSTRTDRSYQQGTHYVIPGFNLEIGKFKKLRFAILYFHIIIRNLNDLVFGPSFPSANWIFKGRGYVTPDKNTLYHIGSHVCLPSSCKNICHVVTAFFSLLIARTLSNQYPGPLLVFVKSIFNNSFRLEQCKKGLKSPTTFSNRFKIKNEVSRDYISMICSLGPEV